MSDYPPPYPLHGLSEDDIAALYDAAWAEIEGSASAQCVVWKGGLRRLIDSYRSLMIATPPAAWRVGDRARVVTDNQYGDGAADIGIEFTVEGLREGARGQTVLLTSKASRGHDGFYADRCAALLDAARAEQKEDAEPVAWRYRYPLKLRGGWTAWSYCIDKLTAEELAATDGQVVPLYAHPPRAEQPVMSREGVKEIVEQVQRGATAEYAVRSILALASLGGRVGEDGSSRNPPIVDAVPLPAPSPAPCDLEDAISDALQDSLGPEWTCRLGAQAIVRLLKSGEVI